MVWFHIVAYTCGWWTSTDVVGRNCWELARLHRGSEFGYRSENIDLNPFCPGHRGRWGAIDGAIARCPNTLSKTVISTLGENISLSSPNWRFFETFCNKFTSLKINLLWLKVLLKSFGFGWKFCWKFWIGWKFCWKVLDLVESFVESFGFGWKFCWKFCWKFWIWLKVLDLVESFEQLVKIANTN